MGTPLDGVDGYVYVSGSVVALVKAWSADFGPELQDFAVMDGTRYKRRTAGARDVTGKIDVVFCKDDSNGQTILQNNALGGSAVLLALYPSGTANSFSGTAFLRLSVNADATKQIDASYSFSANGPWSYS